MRRPDVVMIESVQGGDFAIVVDRSTQYEIVNSLTEPNSARFELGDDGTWTAIKDALAIGARFRVYVNDQPRLTGRALTRGLPISASAGATVQMQIRTVLADATYASAEEFSLKGASLKDAILGVFEPLGLTEKDFIFNADVARDLVTGRGSSSGKPPANLLPLKQDQVKVQPPETIRAFAERHLNRFHLMIWDAPDGRIVVGAPDDTQQPMIQLRCRFGVEGRNNNVLELRKSEDYEDVPTVLGVYGAGAKAGRQKAKARWEETDPVLSAVQPPLFRRVTVMDDGIATQALAEARARLEMTARSMMKDSWTATLDGLSYWDGARSILYGPDTVADVQADAMGGQDGAYLVHTVRASGDANNGDTTELDMVARGIWRL